MQNAPYLSAVPPEEGKKSPEESRTPGTCPSESGWSGGLGHLNSSGDSEACTLFLPLPSACCVTLTKHLNPMGLHCLIHERGCQTRWTVTSPPALKYSWVPWTLLPPAACPEAHSLPITPSTQAGWGEYRSGCDSLVLESRLTSQQTRVLVQALSLFSHATLGTKRLP